MTDDTELIAEKENVQLAEILSELKKISRNRESDLERRMLIATTLIAMASFSVSALSVVLQSVDSTQKIIGAVCGGLALGMLLGVWWFFDKISPDN